MSRSELRDSYDHIYDEDATVVTFASLLFVAGAQLHVCQTRKLHHIYFRCKLGQATL
jgi:hypothetical protein